MSPVIEFLCSVGYRLHNMKGHVKKRFHYVKLEGEKKRLGMAYAKRYYIL